MSREQMRLTAILHNYLFLRALKWQNHFTKFMLFQHKVYIILFVKKTLKKQPPDGKANDNFWWYDEVLLKEQNNVIKLLLRPNT